MLLVATLGALIFAWALADLVAGRGFVLLVSDELHAGEEAASALARLFAAFVLILFFAERSGRRLGWVAAGLVVLGLGNFACGYLEPLLEGRDPELNEGLYEDLIVRTVACALLAVGLLAKAPPRPPFGILGGGLIALVAGQFIFFEILHGAALLPALARDGISGMTASAFDRLTPWHWVLSSVALVLAVFATAGALKRHREDSVPAWLPIAMTLYAGSLLHEYLWPTPYGGNTLTTADVLRLAFAVALAVGGVLEIRRIASERATLLAAERERTRRLEELAEMKADFSAMVAHELCGPVAAIRNLTEMIGDPGLDDGLKGYATRGLEHEADALDALISDVRAAAAVERDDFRVRIRPVSLAELLPDAEAYASTILPGGGSPRVLLEGVDGTQEVLADAGRVRQVLRNLLSNAAKYSPAGVPVELRVKKADERVRFEVADRGPGIHPDDLKRIFEKFGRGSDREGKKVPGVGLGLYLSRRIVRAHGSELRVRTRLGEGSAFSFELKAAR